MNIELFIVPDYFCSGVIERYFKVSSVISNGTHEVVLSTIINKKTNALQRQSKIDPPPRIKRTAIYGWDRTSKVIVGMNGLASEYPNLTDDEKHLLYQCMINMRGAAVQAWKKMLTVASCPAVFDQQERTEGDRLASEQYREYCDIRNGIAPSAPAVETVENPPAVEEESPAVETVENPPAVEEESTSTAVARKSSAVARMVNAYYLTEFVEGNIYGIKENSEITVNGNTYITLLNEQGDERQVNKSRIVVESRYDEPPVEE